MSAPIEGARLGGFNMSVGARCGSAVFISI
jgi:hypothetical protein